MKNSMVFEQELHKSTIADCFFGINQMEVKHNNSDLCTVASAQRD